MKRLAIITTHPIQYNAPFFQLLNKSKVVKPKIFYTWGGDVLEKKYDPGFNKTIEWDIPLLAGYEYEFLENTAISKGSHHFNGIINPGIIKKIDAFKPDALLVYGWKFRSHLQVLRHYKNRVPVWFRGDSVLLNEKKGIKSLCKKVALQWVYRHIDKALYCGTNNKIYFEESGLQPDQLIRAFHAVENERFENKSERYSEIAGTFKTQLKIDSGDIVFLFAGKLIPTKDLATLIEVISKFNKDGVHLVIVGNGPLESSLKTMSEATANIHFLDFQNQTVMPAVYQICDIFVLPSMGETWGLSVNEAMAAGKAILISDKCGCAIDLVKNGENGYIFKAKDRKDLFEKMLLLTEAGEDLKHMKANSIKEFKISRFKNSWKQLKIYSIKQVISQANNIAGTDSSETIKTNVFSRSISFDNRKLTRIIFDQESTVVFIILLFSQLFFPNGSYLFLCLLTIYLIFYVQQQPLKSGVFTLIACNHILQIIAGVWQADYVGMDINYRSSGMSDATIASCIGLFVMFIPISYFQNKLPSLSLDDLKKEAQKFSTDKTFTCYLAAYFIAGFLNTVLFVFAGLAQLVISLVKIKWLFFLLFGYQSILKKERRNTFYLFILIEFLSGFFSFFSNFKTVIYAAVILFLSLIQIINIKKVMYGAMIGGGLFLFALVWTGIKTQYRSFINGGSKEQVVSVSGEDALNKIYDLSSNVTDDDLNSSMYQMLDRVQYTYHFAKTIQRVPSVIPYTNGKNWMDNIEFCTTPRYFNPNKPTLDATEKTRKYTGLSYAGRESGASFSLGYFAECYIDFGLWGMMFPLFLIGLMYGLTYKYLMKNSSKNFVFNYSVVGAFFMEFFAFEMDGTFLLGRFLASLVTFIMCIKFLFPWVIRYISVPVKKIPAA